MTTIDDIISKINRDDVSSEHPLTKTESECFWIQPLLHHLGIDLNRVEKSERPDFIVDGHIGIEMVGCYPLNHSKGVCSEVTEVYLNLVSIEYKKHLDSLGLHFLVTINYKDNVVFNNKIKVKPVKFTQDVIAELERFRSNPKYLHFKYINGASFRDNSINVVKYFRTEWVADIDKNALVETIDSKNKKLSQYKQLNPQLNQFWLFLYCPDMVELNETVGDYVKSSFDRTFIYVSLDAKMVEINNKNGTYNYLRN